MAEPQWVYLRCDNMTGSGLVPHKIPFRWYENHHHINSSKDNNYAMIMCVNGTPCRCGSDICIIHYITNMPTLRTKLTLTNVINPYTKQATDIHCSVYIYLRYISCECSASGHSVHYVPHREVILPSTETAASVDFHVPVISTIASNRLDLGGHASRSCWRYWPQIKVQSVQRKPR